MVQKKQYEVNPRATTEMFTKAGFTDGKTYYTIRKFLYEKSIKLTIYVHKDDMSMDINVRSTNDESEYVAFWNEDWQRNNKVADQVISAFNNFMDSLVKKRVMRYVKANKGITSGKEIKIRYASEKINKLEYIDGKSDWIDLRAAEDVKLHKGQYKLISLGVAMQLPEGYEAHIVPRSSTFKNFGVIQTNHMGVIDCSYCGNDDVWRFPAYALRDTEIHVNDRICQFRIIKNQPKINFCEVDNLSGKNRGGIGSTGRN